MRQLVKRLRTILTFPLLGFNMGWQNETSNERYWRGKVYQFHCFPRNITFDFSPMIFVLIVSLGVV